MLPCIPNSLKGISMELTKKKDIFKTTFVGSLTVGIALKDLYSGVHSLFHTPEDQFKLPVTARHLLYVSC